MPAKNFLRRGVNQLGKHLWMRPLFFWLGFFSIRLAYPLQYLLLRELIDCQSVLDLGCGRHSMVPIIPSNVITTGVELFEPHYQEAVKKGRHNYYIQKDIRHVSFPDKSFDAVVILDVLEHLTKDEGRDLIKKMQNWARKKVLIFTPNGFLLQDGYDENPLMEHKSGWTTKEFELEGFKVRGVRGFKSLIKEKHHDEENSRPDMGDVITDLTQVLSYHIPEKAFQLFCVKEMAE